VISFAGQQPIALEDKHISFLQPLQAQPEKRVTSAESAAGAALWEKTCQNLKKSNVAKP